MQCALSAALVLAGMGAASAQSWYRDARTQRPASGSGDTTVLAIYQDGDFTVRRYVVNRNANRDNSFTIRYHVGMADLQRKEGNNQEELNDLQRFIDRLMADSLAEVKSIRITGYASPDGSPTLNKRLATQRAEDFRAYVDARYGLSRRYPVTVDSRVEDWEACRPLVERADLADEQAVLRILDGSASAASKEQQLKRLPNAWNALRTRILPQLRRVVMTVEYGQGAIVEERTQIVPVIVPEPEPVVVPEPACCQCGLMGDGLIIDMDAQIGMLEGYGTEVMVEGVPSRVW